MPAQAIFFLSLAVLLSVPACAVETLTFAHKPHPAAEAVNLSVSGHSLAQDSAGNRFFETIDGARYFIPKKNLLGESSDDLPFEAADSESMARRLLSELPEGFRIHTTDHYVIAYSTSREYAEWTSSLLEGLYKVLVRYWRKQGVQLTEPEFPLPIIIHSSTASYNASAAKEGVGRGATGYYNQATNRVRMYDLTGSEELMATVGRPRRGSRREITQMLARPAAEPLIATIVHEATHQVCFNTGLMQRMTELPLWLVEGMAVYFEAPEAGSSNGWRGIGKVNHRRLATFRRNLPEWNASSLTSLIGSDDRLRDPRTAGAAYADAWALNYYLFKRKPKQYVAYVKELSEIGPLDGPPADETTEQRSRRRIERFTKHFGELEPIERDFLRTITRL